MMHVVNLPSRQYRLPSRRVAVGAQRRTGFTLIEVLVALTIFVIGAIAIIRIFPPAFGVIQGSEYRSIAAGLDRSTLARFSSHSELIPDATMNLAGTPYTVASPFSPSVAIAVNGTSSRNASVPNDVTPSAFTQSALNFYKDIVRERHQILADQNGTLFTFATFPFVGVKAFREDYVDNVQIAADGSLNFANATLHSDSTVSFSEGPAHPERPPTDMRDVPGGAHAVGYYVSYRWVEQGQTQGVMYEPVEIPEDIPWDTNAGKVLQGKRTDTGSDPTFRVLSGPVSVRFRYQVTVGPPGTLGNQLGYVNLTNVANGVSTGTPPTLATPLQAGNDPNSNQVSLDYSVADWRLIVNDGTPDRVPPETTATPLPNSMQVTAPARPMDDTQPLISVLWGTYTSGFQQGVVQLNAPEAFPGATTNVTAVDFKNGHVTYDTTSVDSGNIHAPHARVVYETRDGWAHQVSVAARSYLPFYPTITYPSTNTPREQWREYYWQGPNRKSTAPSSNIYFRPSEAGKTLLISFRYVDSNGAQQNVTSVLSIDEHLGNLPVGLTGFNETQVAILPITDQSGNPIPAANMLAITAVAGSSLLARTAWTDQARYQQAAVVNYR